MWRVYLVTVFLLSGCANFEFNTSMCDQIGSDPHANVPQECRNYNEDEAKKAFNNTKHKKDSNDEEIIKFQQESQEDE
jgi:hypothetical protein